MSNKKIKDSYVNYHDEIIKKRYKSKFKLRSYAHEKELNSIINYIKKKLKIFDNVLDAGCGEGHLCILLKKKGFSNISGIDISEGNIKIAKKINKDSKLNINFNLGDAENIQFEDEFFNLVFSTHVLEHLPNIDNGVKEIYRLTKEYAIIAMPTCLNPCALVQCGYGEFYNHRIRDFLALLIGFLRLIWAFITFSEGVDETYGPDKMPHIWRFPWVIKKILRRNGFEIIHQEASTLTLPYFEFLLPLINFLDKHKSNLFFKNFAYGTIMVVKKIK